MKTGLWGCLVLAACCAVASVRTVHAQETINFASVSGRVTDPQGAVVPGAHVSARQTETNVLAETITNSEGRFRFPYLKVGTYELKVHVDGFADSTRMLKASLGAAFDIPVVARASQGSTRASRSQATRRCSKRRGARLRAPCRNPRCRACR